MTSLWMVCVASMGYAVAFFLVAKRIRMIAGVRDALSLPDIVAARYSSETMRALTAITILLGVIGYLATQILAMALVLQTLLGATETFAGISLVVCVAISLAVLVFYSVTGGIVASVYTDLVQGAVMVAAGGFIVFAAAAVFEGGLAQASATVFADDPEAMLPFGTTGIVASLGWAFVFGMGLAAQPHLVTKFMMNRRLSDNRLIFPAALFGYFMAALLWLCVGVVMRAVVVGGELQPLGAPDSAAPVFLELYAHPLLAGVVFAALFAAIMSTSDAFLNVGTAAVVHDLPRALTGRTLTRELLWARVTTVVITLVAAGFALWSYYGNARLIALLGAFGWSTFAAALVPVVVIGLNWKRASPRAAAAAVVASLVLNFAIEIFSVRLPWGLNGGYVAILASMTLFLTWSWLERPRALPADIDRIMDL
jgi:Na+/proline symporter